MSQHPTKTSPPHKVLVIGLDGATFDLIKPWVAEGHLPTLGRLLTEGAHGDLRSTMPPMTGPAWTSFATGANPGRHGLYDWVAREPDSYNFTPITGADAAAPSLYRLLSQAGRRVCALNVPMTYPPEPVNGLLVSGLPAPSLDSGITYPGHLYQEILDSVGDYILYPDPGRAYSASGVEPFLKRLYRCTDLRAQTFDYLRRKEAWDFAMLVFNGTDTISHAMWKYMDRTHPLHNPRHAATYGTAIRDYYAYVDHYLAHLVETLDAQTTLFIMSDHGFGPFHKFIHVNNWLIREGLMAIRPNWRARLKARLFRLGFAPMNIYNLLMSLGLGGLKGKVVRGRSGGQSLMKTLFLSFGDIDWSRTVAYSMGNIGQIRLNVVGREPQGCVQPGADYDRCREQIITRLAELRDPATGEQVVEAIYRCEEIYDGPQVEQAADILFMPRRLEYFGFGEYEFGSHQIVEAMKQGISGTHRMNGVMLVYGPTIRPGCRVEGAALPDLAPTILRVMGLPAPAHMDGRVLTEMLQPTTAPLAEPPAAWNDGPSGGAASLTAEEQQMLSERLRSLGYVG